MDLNAELLKLLNKSIISEDVFSLIKLGANPNILTRSGYTLLHILIFKNKMDKAFRLVEQFKADINVKDCYGLPPLYYMLNDSYSIEHLLKMVQLGADPKVRNKNGSTVIHFFIRKNFSYARLALEKNPECARMKDFEGTPLEIMLNMRHSKKFTPDNYLDIVRCGGDINSVDHSGVSLLTTLIQSQNLSKAQELIALSKIPVTQRVYFTPKFMDYFLEDDGISRLISDLVENEHSAADIAHLAKYPHGKEKVIEHLNASDPEYQRGIIELCLKPDTPLNQFFTTQRGWFMTSNNRGTLAKLKYMLSQLPPKPDECEDSTTLSNTLMA